MTAEPADIERTFAAEGPWQSRFVVDGRAYGGDLPYQEDGRVAEFFDWVGTPSSVLELGSLEGAHSAQLAAAPSVQRLVCLEGREENVRRARAAIEVLGFSRRVQVEQVDLESADLSLFGNFDVAFCAGLLYHLSRPWLLLRELRQRVELLFLDTHVSSSGNIVLGGHRGRLYREHGLDDPFSGLQNFSFWPTAEALDDMLTQAGFEVVRRENWPDWPNGPRVHLLCAASLPLATPRETVFVAGTPIEPPPVEVDIPSLDAPAADLERFFERTGPWQTRVSIGDRDYGGPYPFGEGGASSDFSSGAASPVACSSSGRSRAAARSSSPQLHASRSSSASKRARRASSGRVCSSSSMGSRAGPSSMSPISRRTTSPATDASTASSVRAFCTT